MKKTSLLLIAGICCLTSLSAQLPAPNNDYYNGIFTAMPFLRINTDARSGSLGNMGVATSPDAGSIFLNAAKLSAIPENNPFGLSVSYAPWLTQLVDGLYLANLAAFIKPNDLQAIGIGVRYFSYGELTFTNASGTVIQKFRPTELSADVAYSRKLTDHFSAAITMRYLYSNLSSMIGSPINNGEPTQAMAGDISVFYSNAISDNFDLSLGANVSNIGPKLYYNSIETENYLPTNLGVGAAITYTFTDHKISLITELNKLLVPTPDTVDVDPQNNIYDFNELSALQGMFVSFADAPLGLEEELNEIIYSAGLEYTYKIISARGGYSYEHPSKGGRQFVTLGSGIAYNALNLQFAYQKQINEDLPNVNDTFQMTIQILLNKKQ
jgi:hypothetical protein